jgi:hypothetical protein
MDHHAIPDIYSGEDHRKPCDDGVGPLMVVWTGYTEPRMRLEEESWELTIAWIGSTRMPDLRWRLDLDDIPSVV